MTENKIKQNQKIGQPTDDSILPIQSRFEVLFEFNVRSPKLTLYRAVRTTDGSFRMEKRGQNAKMFKTIMRCGLEEGLHQFRIAIENYFRNQARDGK